MIKLLVHQTRSWLKRFICWLASARLVWFSMFVVVLSIFMAYEAGTADAIRRWGLALQLLGILAAVIGIRDTGRMFGKPTFLQLVRSWLVSIPRFKPKSQTAELTGIGSSFFTGSASLWAGTKPNASVEDRLAAAEKNLLALESRINKAESGIETNHQEITGKLKNESDARQEQDRQLKLSIESATTDGLHLAAAGAFWLFIGVSMSTIPTEILWCLGAA